MPLSPQAEGGPLIDTVTVVDIFMQFQRLQEVRVWG
jgi:hypothetical protein